MLRPLALLALCALAAVAEDWEARCRELGSESPAQRRAARDAIRHAGPEVEVPLAAAEGSENADLARLAKLCRLARRWDPGSRLVWLEPLLELDSGSSEGAAAAVRVFALMGSPLAGETVSRILASRPDGEIPALLDLMAAGAQRDPGWARVAAGWLASKSPAIRGAAARALVVLGNASEATDLRRAIVLEHDDVARRELWNALLLIARSPEDLPPLPEDPVLYAQVLSSAVLESRRPQLGNFAWHAWVHRGTAQTPSGFSSDLSRIARVGGADLMESSIVGAIWANELAPVLVRRLSDSRNLLARLTVAHVTSNDAAAYLGAVSILGEPDIDARLQVLEQLDQDLGGWTEEDSSARIEHHKRLALAARTALDAASGLATIPEIGAAVREIVAAGRQSYGMAGLAISLLAVMALDGRDALFELESDPDLGTAAANARRFIDLAMHLGGGEFEENLDTPPWVPGIAYDLPVETWFQLVRSNERGDRIMAAELLGSAWDKISLRPEIRELLPTLLADDDHDIQLAAKRFTAEAAPELLPDEPELGPGDAWTRPLGYVISRLRTSVASMEPLTAETARAISRRGDRAMLLAAFRANRFINDEAKESLTSISEPGLLPLLLSSYADLEVTNKPAWFSKVALCGPEGCRWVARFTSEGDPGDRGYALQVLLSSAWGKEIAAAALVQMANSEDEGSLEALLVAVTSGGLRYHKKLPVAAADALARAILRLADKAGPEDPRVQQLIMGVGPDALREASPDLQAELVSDPLRVELAMNSRCWLGPVGNIHERLLSGAPWSRTNALALVGGNDLERMTLVVRAFIETEHISERFDPWSARVPMEKATVFLLDAAVRDETHRDSILEIYRWLRHYYGAIGPAPSEVGGGWRIVEGSIPPEFQEDSMEERAYLAGQFRNNPTMDSFPGLCAAAFRGEPGDHTAIDALRTKFGPDALPSLVPLLFRPDPEVRGSAALAIAHAAGSARAFATVALKAALASERNGGARGRILAGLARLEDSSALTELKRSSNADDPDARLASVRTLALAPTRAAAALLAHLCDDPAQAINEAAFRALQALTGREIETMVVAGEFEKDWMQWLDSHPDAPLHEPEETTNRGFTGFDMEF